jgi:hypothetical protein
MRPAAAYASRSTIRRTGRAPCLWAVFLSPARGVDLPLGRGMRQSGACGSPGNHMPEYLVRLLDDEGHATHAHTVVAASHEAIIRKVASLYRSCPVVEIWAGNRMVARLTAAEMSAIDSS